MTKHQFVKLRVECVLILDTPRAGLPKGWASPRILDFIEAGLAAASLGSGIVGIAPNAHLRVGLWSPRKRKPNLAAKPRRAS